MNGATIASLFRQISNGESFVPLLGPPNRDEGTSTWVSVTPFLVDRANAELYLRREPLLADLVPRAPLPFTNRTRAVPAPHHRAYPRAPSCRIRSSRRREALLRLDPGRRLVLSPLTNLKMTQVIQNCRAHGLLCSPLLLTGQASNQKREQRLPETAVRKYGELYLLHQQSDPWYFDARARIPQRKALPDPWRPHLLGSGRH